MPATCEEPPEPVQCPATPEAARDMPCDSPGAACEFPGDLACYCQVPFDLDAYVCRIHNGAVGPVPLLWYCGENIEGSGCPVGIPAIGAPCPQEEQRCGSPCANQYARRCRGGAWERWLPEHECL